MPSRAAGALLTPPTSITADEPTKAARASGQSFYGRSGEIWDILLTAAGDRAFAPGWAFVQAVNSYEQWNAPLRKTKNMATDTARAVRQFDQITGKGQPQTAKAVSLVLA